MAQFFIPLTASLAIFSPITISYTANRDPTSIVGSSAVSLFKPLR